MICLLSILSRLLTVSTYVLNEALISPGSLLLWNWNSSTISAAQPFFILPNPKSDLLAPWCEQRLIENTSFWTTLGAVKPTQQCDKTVWFSHPSTDQLSPRSSLESVTLQMSLYTPVLRSSALKVASLRTRVFWIFLWRLNKSPNSQNLCSFPKNHGPNLEAMWLSAWSRRFLIDQLQGKSLDGPRGLIAGPRNNVALGDLLPLAHLHQGRLVHFGAAAGGGSDPQRQDSQHHWTKQTNRFGLRGELLCTCCTTQLQRLSQWPVAGSPIFWANSEHNPCKTMKTEIWARRLGVQPGWQDFEPLTRSVTHIAVQIVPIHNPSPVPGLETNTMQVPRIQGENPEASCVKCTIRVLNFFFRDDHVPSQGQSQSHGDVTMIRAEVIWTWLWLWLGCGVPSTIEKYRLFLGTRDMKL